MTTSRSEKELLNEFWDISDLSIYLKVKVKTLYAMVSNIPHYRVGRLIRFRKEEIDSWMESKQFNALGGTNKPRKIKSRPSDKGDITIDKLIRKAIDQSKNAVYNPSHGNSDRIEGPNKETNNGSI